ncbi:MAG: YfcE family phosphodiesterase [Chloroflexi bacterium]|nr:YfcE family phosphodiesterase [Chloroflexota bacterium]
MKIGLISDSHVPAATRQVPEQVFRAFESQDVDLILHAGDIYTESALDHLENLAPVLAVKGPGVDQGIPDHRAQERRVLALGGVHIGLVHQLYLPNIYYDIFPGVIAREFPPDASLQASLRKIFRQDVHVCVFGDTHADLVEWHQDILMVNPGSPTLPYQYRRLGTVGILEIREGQASARILHLRDFPGPEPSYK